MAAPQVMSHCSCAFCTESREAEKAEAQASKPKRKPRTPYQRSRRTLRQVLHKLDVIDREVLCKVTWANYPDVTDDGRDVSLIDAYKHIVAAQRIIAASLKAERPAELYQ